MESNESIVNFANTLEKSKLLAQAAVNATCTLAIFKNSLAIKTFPKFKGRSCLAFQNYLFRHPLRDVPFFFHTEVDAHFHYLLATHGKGICIAVGVDLGESVLSRLVKLQFHDKDMVGGFERDVCPALSRMLLHHNAIVGEQGEDKIHQLLIMTLILRVVAIRNGGKESLEQLQGSIDVSLSNEN